MTNRLAAPFLTAQWRYLAMLNFEIEPSVLAPFVPAATELDHWHGRALVSVVGFRFLETRVRGWAIPFHGDFDEVNLRFYVRRKTSEGWRRGVVFIKELVPRRAVAWVARTFYGENYVTLPMSHDILRQRRGNANELSVCYRWRIEGRDNFLKVSVLGEPSEIAAGSEQEFITEHYWGYSRRSRSETLEYQVSHPKWRVWTACDARLDCDAARVYGDQFANSLQSPPTSAFLADGSEITVYQGTSLAAEAGK